MITIGICDDEKNCIRELENVLQEISTDKTVQSFLSAEDMMDSLEKNRYDILFLDIMIGKRNGKEVAEYLRKQLRNYHTAIVWISSIKEKDVGLFDVNPFAFIEKPIHKEQVIEIVNRYISIKNMDSEVFIFDTIQAEGKNKQNLFIPYKDILFVEAQQRKLKIVTNKGVLETYGKISRIKKEFYLHHFISPHNSYLVNCKQIHKVLQETIILNNGEEVPISRQGKKELHLLIDQIKR